MTIKTDKELGIMFYGNTHIPLSTECDGCHFFNYMCAGSVYQQDCPTGYVEDMLPSETAYKILSDEEINRNHFLLARIAGSDLNETWYHEHIEKLKDKIITARQANGREEYIKALEDSIQHYQDAIQIPEENIHQLRTKYQAETRL